MERAGLMVLTQRTTLQTLVDPLFIEWIPRSFIRPGPGYFAYIPGGGIYPE